MTRVARAPVEAQGFGPSAVAIGVFDGVHTGHQELLRRTRDTARELGLKSAVLTFHPHPACVVAPSRAPRLLYSVEERCELLAAQGIDELLVLPFDQAIAAMPPEEFAEKILRGTMRAQAVLVGENFRFGCRRAGDVTTLQNLGFDMRPLAAVQRRGMVVSSSEIRKRLEQGDVSRAARLLGRAYAISGEIVRGQGIGSKQTVPTLNLRTGSEVLPAKGVYITRTTDLGDKRQWHSITNVGTRPTFEQSEDVSIETFLLQPLDGETPAEIRVEFCRRVRDERRFDSPELLKAQILKDVATARAYFRRLHW